MRDTMAPFSYEHLSERAVQQWEDGTAGKHKIKQRIPAVQRRVLLDDVYYNAYTTYSDTMPSATMPSSARSWLGTIDTSMSVSRRGNSDTGQFQHSTVIQSNFNTNVDCGGIAINKLFYLNGHFHRHIYLLLCSNFLGNQPGQGPRS